MIRRLILPSILLAAATLSSLGCRSCSSCYDYSPPVADCECAHYGVGQRAGSAFGVPVEGKGAYE